MPEQVVTLNPPPGAWRNGTKAEAQGRWFDVNLVRWREGRLRPVGGWTRFYTGDGLAPFRGAIAWRANDLRRWLAAGTAFKLTVHDQGSLYDITPDGYLPGRTTSEVGLGYGAMLYGREGYGTARTEGVSIVIDASVWTLDNFGETLVGVCTGDGRLYSWSPAQFDPGVPAAARKAQLVAGAPVNNAAVFVTAERHVVLLGADADPRKIAWCSREDLTQWTPDPLNTAGEINLATPGRLIRGVRWKNESILFSDADVHRMTFVGSPLVYGTEQVSKSEGLLGPHALVEIPDRLVWMSSTGFWSYDGMIKRVPCDVQDYVFSDINLLQGVKVCGGHNVEFGEVWWFYATANSTENNRYVIWSYREGWWSYGQLARTAWVSREVWPYPVAGGPDGSLYQQEDGYLNNGATRVGSVYAESSHLSLGEGDRWLDVGLLMPDKDDNTPGSEANVSVSFALKANPLVSAYRTAGPYTFNNPTGYCQARFSGRMVEMRVAATADALFTFGRLRASARPGGAR